ncbi:hypothetical protein L195_g032296 [Trifolium pratense]|uniref:Uncharacterized protein n=1 Tax=Trifolium pratense TaxID=57577 RepID=A0A2K3LCU9_TRIPR|nr:hypothetical protein L195_g032296 [Trifolium pratense]
MVTPLFADSSCRVSKDTAFHFSSHSRYHFARADISNSAFEVSHSSITSYSTQPVSSSPNHLP